MSAAEAQVALNTAMSVAARANSIILTTSPRCGRTSRSDPCHRARQRPLRRSQPSRPRLRPAASTANRNISSGEEHVGPRPLGGIVVEAEPELQRIGDRPARPRTAQPSPSIIDPANTSSARKTIGPNIDMWGKHDILQERAVKLECCVGRFLLGPVLQAVGKWQRQLPQHALEPHAADQHPDQPDAEMPAGPLRRIFLPILERNHSADDQERPEQRQDQIAPVSVM